MSALYVEIDEYAAQWLRNLIDAGHIAPGVVDTRSLADLEPEYVRQFVQVHLCAGIAVWSAALRRAGWPDDTPVWTASFPCQGFSNAGKRRGFADERHLWPFGHYLIEQCEPPVVFGEQVESPDGRAWLDLVQDDMEALGYAFGAVVSPAAGYGAPHIRHRTYFVADTDHERRAGQHALLRPEESGWRTSDLSETPRRRGSVDLADDDDDARSQGRRGMPERATERTAGSAGVASELADALHTGRPERRALPGRGPFAGSGPSGGVEQPGGVGRQRRQTPGAGHFNDRTAPERTQGQHGFGVASPYRHPAGPGPVNGHWRASDWLHCRDEKWRPVEPGAFPLAHGAPGRVGRLRAYGNGLVLPQAEEFIRAYIDARNPDVFA